MQKVNIEIFNQLLNSEKGESGLLAVLRSLTQFEEEKLDDLDQPMGTWGGWSA